MNYLRITAVLLLATTFTLISSCGKYDEGPALSVFPKKFRLANTWKVDQIIDEDGDVENVDNNTTYEFKDDNTYTVVSGNFNYSGEWKFTQDKEFIEITYTAGNISYTSEDQILRLTRKELWIQQGDDEYRYVPAD